MKTIYLIEEDSSERLLFGKRILIVEDDRTQQQLLNALITEAGAEVVVASSAEEAWKWLSRNPAPHLALLDIIMPGQSGFQLCRSMREHSPLTNIPIVFCTSKNKKSDRYWALRQGANAFIPKPFSPKQLIDVIVQYVQ